MSKIFTDEEQEFIKLNYHGIFTQELTEKLNHHFNKSYTVNQVKGFKRINGLKSGVNACFKKGHISYNKGKKWDDYLTKEQQESCRKTTFKKGHTSKNSDPIGTEKYKKSSGGNQEYLYVKIQDKKGRFNWKAKHLIIWEEANGPIPPGHKVIFKDKNTHNVTLSNLALVSDNELLILNRRGLTSEIAEVTESSIVLAKYVSAVYKKRKK